jgi:putative ABC transport system substrate-binding protein
MSLGTSWIAIVAAVWTLLGGTALPASARQPGMRYRVGVLDLGPVASSRANLTALRHGLRDLGYVEGQNVLIEYRSADGRAERLTDLARELIRLEVDVIVTTGTSAALSARHVTDTIPIVMAASGDPVFAGLVSSLKRPGGNVTGLHGMIRSDVAGARLQLLRELMPRLSRVGVLRDSGDAYAALMVKDIEKVARRIGVQLHGVDAWRPADLERAFEAAILDRVDALIAVEGILTLADLPRIVQFAAMSRLPAIYGLREFVEAGGLLSYGADRRDLFRRSAGYVDRILKGATAADLPVEAPTKFELVLNLKTARALGLVIPSSLLRRADEVIQ